MARKSSISIYRGEDFTQPFVAYTTDTGSTAENITGWTLLFSVARSRNSTDKLISAACSITVAASGTFSVTIADTITDDIAPGAYFWDVWRTDAGFERLLGSGSFNILGNARIPPSA